MSHSVGFDQWEIAAIAGMTVFYIIQAALYVYNRRSQNTP